MSHAAGPSRPPSTLRRDLLSAYGASAAKVLSWVIVSAVVFRASPVHYAVLALVRATVGLLNYTTVGLMPALIRALANLPAEARPVLAWEEKEPVTSAKEVGGNVLSYEARPVVHESLSPVLATYRAGALAAALAGGVGLILTLVYAVVFHQVHVVPVQVTDAALLAAAMGVGTVLRLLSEAPAALIQTHGSIARDHQLSALAEAGWVFATLLIVSRSTFGGDPVLGAAGAGYVIASFSLLFARRREAKRLLPRGFAALGESRWREVYGLLAAGSVIAVAQLADFLYAPTDYVLINRLISPAAVANYAPAVQIDAGLLLLVGALAAVVLPRAAVSHAAGDVAALRRDYVRGTLASTALLALAAVAIYLLSPWIFRLWLGDPLPETQAILPLVLVHTVLGGASGVGRSVLLGMGKVKPFAAAALVAGAANVLLSYAFVVHFDLGLKGIIYGTIIAVAGRAVLWQPWYVMRTLRAEGARG